ncbi:hypothetical protein Tco_0579297 [Tanacetum coccineum]
MVQGAKRPQEQTTSRDKMTTILAPDEGGPVRDDKTVILFPGWRIKDTQDDSDVDGRPLFTDHFISRQPHLLKTHSTLKPGALITTRIIHDEVLIIDAFGDQSMDEVTQFDLFGSRFSRTDQKTKTTWRDYTFGFGGSDKLSSKMSIILDERLEKGVHHTQ